VHVLALSAAMNILRRADGPLKRMRAVNEEIS
jgi:hypothetical protein